MLAAKNTPSRVVDKDMPFLSYEYQDFERIREYENIAAMVL
jgi:hypothetical protein